MPHINPSRAGTPVEGASPPAPESSGSPSRPSTPTARALALVENVPATLSETIRSDMTPTGASTEGASSAATETARYLQALSEWEGRGQAGEDRAKAALEIRTYLENPHPHFIHLHGLGLRESPPLPDAPKLNFNMNQITEFPALPDGIEWFWCSRNPLVRVPHLPAGLTNFAMGDTQMSSMPALPDTLTALSVTNCGLTTLPDSWPPALEQLLLNNNRLTHIPPLPSTLKICSLDNNQLTELPDNYMAMQHPHAVIYIRENPLSEDVQQLIQELRDDSASRPFINNRPDPDDEADDGWAFDSGSDSDDETRPLTEAVESWYSLDQWEAVQAQWQAFTHEPQADEFSRFIDRLAMSLQATEPTLREAFHAAVATWLDRLAHDAELRADTFAFAEEAGTTCADRAALSFLQMTRLRAVHDVTAGRYDQAPVALLGVARSILRQEALERLAEERVTARPTDEEIEVYLAFLTQRSERLQLSLELTEMTFPQLGEVTDQELDQAAAAVEALDDTLPHFLSNWEPWRSVLQRWDPELFQAAQDRLYNSLDNGDFEAHARTQGFVGPAAAQALYHDVFGPLTQAYLKDKGLSL